MNDTEVASNRKVKLGAISRVPSSYTEDTTFFFPGGDAELRYTFEFEGTMCQAGIRFLDVRAYAYRAEAECTPWHIEDAYDELVEVTESDWLASLSEASTVDIETTRHVRHFLVYIDGSGAFEVAAKNYEWLDNAPTSGD